MTKNEIKAELKTLGIEYDESLDKAELKELLEAAQAQTAPVDPPKEGEQEPIDPPKEGEQEPIDPPKEGESEEADEELVSDEPRTATWAEQLKQFNGQKPFEHEDKE